MLARRGAAIQCRQRRRGSAASCDSGCAAKEPTPIAADEAPSPAAAGAPASNQAGRKPPQPGPSPHDGSAACGSPLAAAPGDARPAESDRSIQRRHGTQPWPRQSLGCGWGGNEAADLTPGRAGRPQRASIPGTARHARPTAPRSWIASSFGRHHKSCQRTAARPQHAGRQPARHTADPVR